MARPTKLTPELAEGIVARIRHGTHPLIAAGAYGVAVSTYYEWLERGEAVDPRRPMDPIYSEFAEGVRAAEHQYETVLAELALAKVRTTGDAIMLLERRFPDRWQRREEVTVNLRREAEKLAAETGLNADDILAEANRIFAEAVQ